MSLKRIVSMHQPANRGVFYYRRQQAQRAGQDHPIRRFAAIFFFSLSVSFRLCFNSVSESIGCPDMYPGIDKYDITRIFTVPNWYDSMLTWSSWCDIDVKTEDDLLPPGSKSGTVPTDLEQSTGLERLELLGKMRGIDLFDMRPLDASRKGMFTFQGSATVKMREKVIVVNESTALFRNFGEPNPCQWRRRRAICRLHWLPCRFPPC